MGPTLAGRRNGIVSQALTSKLGLEACGVTVDLITPWEQFAWEKYDAIHIFGLGFSAEFVAGLRSRGVKNICLSPIFDTNRPNLVNNMIGRLDFRFASLRSSLAEYRRLLQSVDKVLVRSNFEAEKVSRSFDIPESAIIVSPLPVRFKAAENAPEIQRERICSHVSILSAPIKNVKTLIRAAIKYDFELCLGGSTSDQRFEIWLKEILQAHRNVTYLGVLTDDELTSLYRRTKVFALPSLAEGVGLVALEAALHGADIILTNRGGPKEYYAGMAKLVDPSSVDDIGRAVVSLLHQETEQPRLARHVAEQFSLEVSTADLLRIYRS